MIRNVLDPAFVRTHLDRVSRVARTLNSQDIQAAYAELDAAQADRMTAKIDGQPWQATPPFMPRSPRSACCRR